MITNVERRAEPTWDPFDYLEVDGDWTAREPGPNDVLWVQGTTTTERGNR